MDFNNAVKELGGLVAAFYRELIKEGIPQEDALELSRTYLQGLQDKPKQSAVPNYRPGIDPHEFAQGEQPRDSRSARQPQSGGISDPHDLN